MASVLCEICRTFAVEKACCPGTFFERIAFVASQHGDRMTQHILELLALDLTEPRPKLLRQRDELGPTREHPLVQRLASILELRTEDPARSDGSLEANEHRGNA